MHPIINISISVLLAILGAFSSSHASLYPDKNGQFIERSAEGWHWYEPIPEEQEAEPEKPIEPETQPNEITLTLQQVEPTPAGPAPMTTAWFRENLPKYRDAAIDNPTRENVETYMYLQRAAMDKAQGFAEQFSRVSVGNPWLDEINRRSLATFGTQTQDRYAGEKRRELIKTLPEKTGIFYFFRADCVYCQKQAPILKTFADTNGFEVIAISLDGMPMPGKEFPNFKVDQGQARMLGVDTVPSIFLVDPKSNIVSPIGIGMMAYPELEERILIAAINENWISETEFLATRAVDNIDQNLSSEIESGELDELATSSGSESGFIEPSRLHKYLEKQIQGLN